MRLISITIENYRCLGKVAMEPDSGLTFLAGDNGSGKSAFLDAVQFLSDWIRVGADACCGYARGVPHLGQRRLDFATLIRHGARAVTWDVTYLVPSSIEVKQILRGARGVTWNVTYLVPSPIEVKQILRYRLCLASKDGVPCLRSETVEALSDGQATPVAPDAIGAAKAALTRLCLLQPTNLRGCAPFTAASMDRYGSDFTSRLDATGTRTRPATWPPIGPRIVPDHDIPRVTFAGWRIDLDVHAHSGAYVPPELASDGEAMLAYLAYLAAFPPSATDVVLIDEPTAGLTGRSQRMAAEYLEAIAHSRQVIVATHSAPVLDLAGSRDRIWIVERSHGEGTTLTRLADHPQAGPLVPVLGPGWAAEQAWDPTFTTTP